MINWYAISTYSGREDAVERELNRRISLSHSPRSFREVRVPKYTEHKKLKDGKTKEVEKVTMPGYVLIQMDVDDKMAESLVRNTDGVIGFVGVAGKASPLSTKDVDNIIGKSISASKPKLVVDFVVGDIVEFIDGPFAAMQAYVEDVMEGKLKVSLEGMFDRTVEVETEVSKVRKVRG